jgi:hypothetical protein
MSAQNDQNALSSQSRDSRCGFRTRDGRRCRMLRWEQHDCLCLHHLRQQCIAEGRLPPEPPALGHPGALDHPWAVRRTLKRIYAAALNGRIEPRTAEVLGYLARMLLIRTRRRRRVRKRAHPEPARGRAVSA